MKTRILFIILGVFAVFYLYTQYQKYSSRPMPTELNPIVEEKMNSLITKTEERGISIIITDGFRSEAEQNVLYQRGRSTDGQIVTYAKGGESYHNYGLAIDFALRNDNDEIIWDMEYDGNQNGESDWMEVVSLAKELGFSWGGDFSRFKDYPHFQMDFGLSIQELQWGKRPPDVID
ncbi:M15 family metallopeptidase [Gracilibacillus caseinilyticus]|uniref:M15 family metallopeptidase n=1 Tax=Gracilibacillus caseinilyticus TaxID=2932256 RepID=A0ABY4EZB0_9BACI|nr:M15 family metallopeptidase [Gracilibacillus caseinilyticus]UOQ49203.1 M15 family metallopeptidase [Gracilibacillus caseinilyticus]